MKITRQGVLDLNTNQINGKRRPLHPLEIQELDLRARALDYKPGEIEEELSEDQLADYVY
jgi:hypothetical protein